MKSTPSRSSCKKTSLNLIYNVIAVLRTMETSRMRVNESKSKEKHIVISNDRLWNMSKAERCWKKLRTVNFMFKTFQEQK